MGQLQRRIRNMGYAILRIKKLKSAIAIRNSLKHAFREQETPNADLTRLEENTHIGAESSQQAIEKFNAGLPTKIRKNAVLALEYLITASPEDMANKTRDEQDKYFADALGYLHKKYNAENVFYAGVHRDETTPHMYAYVLPKLEDKLNARHFIGGHKDRMSELQTEFHEEVGNNHGLERGVKGSQARHQDIGRYYAKVNAKAPSFDSVELPEKGLLEKKDDYEMRILNAVDKAIQPRISALVAKAAATDDVLERIKVMELAKASQRKQMQDLQSAIRHNDEKLNASQKRAIELFNAIANGGPELEKVRIDVLAAKDKAARDIKFNDKSSKNEFDR